MELKRALLFLVGCMGARLSLTYAAYRFPELLPWLGLFAACVSAGFTLIYVNGWRKTGVETLRDQMFAGAPINSTEHRAVQHVALRNHSNRPAYVDGNDVMPEVRAALDHIRAFSESIRSGRWLGWPSMAWGWCAALKSSFTSTGSEIHNTESTWTHIGSGTTTNNPIGQWTINWDSSALVQGSGEAQAAQQLVRFFTSPAVADIVRATGLDPVNR